MTLFQAVLDNTLLEHPAFRAQLAVVAARQGACMREPAAYCRLRSLTGPEPARAAHATRATPAIRCTVEAVC